MFVAEVRFALPGAREVEDPAECLWNLRAAWSKNGQVLGLGDAVFRDDDTLVLVVHLPEARSLWDQYASAWVREALAELRAQGFGPPEITLRGEDTTTAASCECTERGWLLLWSAWLWENSPLRCGECLRPIPLYRYPLLHQHGEYLWLLSWQSTYRACDALNMGCGAGERFATRQMERIDSPLVREGREHCQAIEQVTGTPTYYYLHREAEGRRDPKGKRRCPSCDGAWRLDEPLHDWLDFRCQPCRLISIV